MNLIPRWLDRTEDREVLEYFSVPEYTNPSRLYFAKWADKIDNPNFIGACCSSFTKKGDSLRDYCVRAY